jgi:phosphatidylserine/phosphatidylglycerophosphate/cardiolipin synthase-like enzyme
MVFKCELIIHNDYINNRETGLPFQKFIDAGGKFYFSDEENPMHNKFCIIDNQVLINGSYNWTYYAESKNRENVLIIKDEKDVIELLSIVEFSVLIELLEATTVE